MLMIRALVLVCLSIKCTICIVEQYYSQEKYCKNREVLKVRIVEDGTIINLKIKNENPRKPNPKYGYQIFEFVVLDVFKSSLHSQITKNTYWYGMTKERKMADDNGIDVYRTEYLFYFDDWKRIVVTAESKQWRLTSLFQRNALKHRRYDCSCALNNCLDRLAQKVGYVRCELNVNSLACSRDKDGKCTWKGGKKTCINPYKDRRNMWRRVRKLRRH